jgi:hypothetical protein
MNDTNHEGIDDAHHTADEQGEHPKFTEAMETLERLQASGPLDQDTLLKWMLQLAEYAPDSIRAFLIGEAYRTGRFPKAEYFTPDQQPIYTAEQLAEHFDVTVEDIASNIKRMASQGILVIPPVGEGKTTCP